MQLYRIKNAWKHFQTIIGHKYLVMQGCFAVGLYKQGILHDLSKFSPEEFKVGVIYFQGNRSPNNAEREAEGYSSSWLHHKGRNKHHYEYWIDYTSHGMVGDSYMGPTPMPTKYLVEMFMDRIAASKIYEKENYNDAKPLEYFLQGKDHAMIHKKTRRQLKYLLTMLAEQGEEYTFSYIRKRVIKKSLKKFKL